MRKRLLKYLLMTGVLLPLQAYAAGIADMDNGTGPDGVFIFPKMFAMFCDLSSSDSDDAEKVTDCLNKIIALKFGDQGGKVNYRELFVKAYREISSNAMDTALTKKSLAGDYETQIDEELEKADTAGAKSSDEDTVRKKQEQIARLSTMTTQNNIDLINVFSAQLALDAMDKYYTYEFSSSLPNPEEE